MRVRVVCRTGKRIGIGGLVFGCCLVLVGVWSGSVYAYPLYVSGYSGNDISWPKSNCTSAIPNGAAFGIVGANGGLDYTENPCLLFELHQFASYSLYMNTGFPGLSAVRPGQIAGPRRCAPKQSICLAYNYGYNAAEYTLDYANSQLAHSRIWWLDVETENSWSPDVIENRAALEGMVNAIEHMVPFAAVGVYSTPLQWQIITGGWKNGLPDWVGTGSADRSVAERACKKYDFTGGGTLLTQYVLRLDTDYVC